MRLAVRIGSPEMESEMKHLLGLQFGVFQLKIFTLLLLLFELAKVDCGGGVGGSEGLELLLQGSMHLELIFALFVVLDPVRMSEEYCMFGIRAKTYRFAKFSFSV